MIDEDALVHRSEHQARVGKTQTGLPPARAALDRDFFSQRKESKRRK